MLMRLAREIEQDIQRQYAEIRNELRILDGTEQAQAILDEALSLEDAAERLYQYMACAPEYFDPRPRMN
jgi:hypothetical protein